MLSECDRSKCAWQQNLQRDSVTVRILLFVKGFALYIGSLTQPVFSGPARSRRGGVGPTRISADRRLDLVILVLMEIGGAGTLTFRNISDEPGTITGLN